MKIELDGHIMMHNYAFFNILEDLSAIILTYEGSSREHLLVEKSESTRTQLSQPFKFLSIDAHR
nr:unnamed protein product [Callosobruchus chinensis]